MNTWIDDAWERRAFYLGGIALGFAGLLINDAPADLDYVALGAVSGALLICFDILRRRGSWPEWTRVPVIAFFFLMIFFLRGASEGPIGNSPQVPLILVPVIIFAVSGTRPMILAAWAMAVTTIAAPILLIGAPDYPASEWGRVITWAPLLFAVGFVVERLVRGLRDQADEDPLTGVANARAFSEQVEVALARSERTGDPVSVAVIDLDHFKELNDTRGHRAGDLALKRATRSWEQGLRAVDLLGRIGGEEFGVVFENTSAREAAAVAERLRRTMPDGLTCSIGVAEWDSRESRATLMMRADRAMYGSKSGGRDRVTIDVGETGGQEPFPHFAGDERRASIAGGSPQLN